MLNILKAADSNEKKKENIQMVWYVKIEVYVVSQMHLCFKYLFTTPLSFEWLVKGPKCLALMAVAIIWWGNTIFLPKDNTDIVNQAQV